MYMNDILKLTFSSIITLIGLFFMYKGEANIWEVMGVIFLLWGNEEYSDYRTNKKIKHGIKS